MRVAVALQNGVVLASFDRYHSIQWELSRIKMDSHMFHSTSGRATLGRRTIGAIVKRNDCPVAEVATDAFARLNIKELALQGMHAVRHLTTCLWHRRRAILNAVACTQIERTVSMGHHRLASSTTLSAIEEDALGSLHQHISPDSADVVSGLLATPSACGGDGARGGGALGPH